MLKWNIKICHIVELIFDVFNLLFSVSASVVSVFFNVVSDVIIASRSSILLVVSMCFDSAS